MLTKFWRCCRKKPKLSPLFQKPHFPTSSLPEACKPCSLSLLISKHLQLTHSAHLVFQQAPDPFHTARAVNPFFCPQDSTAQIFSGPQSWSRSDTRSQHTDITPHVLVRSLHPSADDDCSRQLFPPRPRPQTPPPGGHRTVSSLTCPTISRFRRILKLMPCSCQFSSTSENHRIIQDGKDL